MQKKLTLLLLTLCFLGKLNAQLLQTYTGDNYSGINGAMLQPASLADSRYQYDVNFFGYQNALASNYGAFNANFLSNPTSISGFKYYRESRFKSFHYQNQEIHFASFMYTITPKDALGFIKRTRTIGNLDGLDPDLALLLFSDMNNATLINKPITSKKLSYQKMKYKETAFSYARVLINDKERFLKAGVTLKVLNGVEALSLYSKNAQVTAIDASNTQFTNTEFTYGYSRNTSAGFNNKMSVGFDLGFVYEYRPNHKTFIYEMDGKNGLVRRDLNKYKFRIGASLLDIGRIKFTKTDNSGDFIANQNVNGLAAVNKNNLADINSFITTNPAFQADGGNKGTFKMNLPTALSLQADYHFINNIYFSYMSYLPIWLKSDEAKVHNLMTNVLSVRYEKKRFGASIPVTLTRGGQINAGVNVRFGAVTVGTTNLSSYLMGKRRLYDLNFHISFRMSKLYPAPADKDGDKVSDKKDYCPTEPGLLKLEGCPDKDLDGLADYKDYCPNVAGPLNFNGCPDTDGDGVLDYLDACPTEIGFAINKGCPDRDKDGILDVADRCPDVPGIKENNGCPEEPIVCCTDSDGDGILDRFDDCPEVFGALINKGCPADSVNTGDQKSAPNDKQTKPNNKASENKGTNSNKPFGDKPENPVNKGNKGTNATATGNKPNEKAAEKTGTGKESTAPAVNPADKTENKPIVKTDSVANGTVAPSNTTTVKTENKPATKTDKTKGNKNKIKTDTTLLINPPTAIVYFKKDRHDVATKYRADINKLIRQMKGNPTAKLLIQGHTDNDGDEEYNINLSHKRTMEVRDYIVKTGRIDPKRIEILYFGEKQPVIENTDEKKKQVNRRVELKIIP